MPTVNPKADRFNALMNNLLGSVNGQVYNAPKVLKGQTVEQRKAASRRGNAVATQKSIQNALPKLAKYSSSAAKNAVNVTPNLELLKGDELNKAVDDLVGGDGWFDDVKNIGGDILGRVGDIASRPLYGVYNGYIEAKEAANAREGIGPESSDGGFELHMPVAEDFTNYASGFLKGFTGAKDEDPEKSNKSTPGEAIELFDKPFFKYHREHETPIIGNETVQKTINRGVGFGGEVWGDPANLFGGKSLGVLRDVNNVGDAVKVANTVGTNVKKGQGIKNALTSGRRATVAVGKDITHDTIESVYDNVAENAFKNIPELAGKKVKGGRVHKPTGTIRGGSRTIAQSVATQMAQQADDALLTANGRAVGARNAMFKNAVISRGVQETRNLMLKDFDNFAAGNISPSRYNQLVASGDPIFKAYDDALNAALKTDPANARGIAERAARDSIQGTLDKVVKNLEKELDGTMYNTFAIRIGNKAIPIKTLGKAYATAQDKIGFRAPKAFSYAAQLPGISGQFVGNARRYGHQNFEEKFLNGFTEQVVDPLTGQTVTNKVKGAREVAKLYNKADRRSIMRHVHNETNPGGHLQEGVDFIRDAYRRIDEAEVEAGVRSAAAAKPSNYQYLHVPSGVGPGSTKRYKDFEQIKEARRAESEVHGRFLSSPEDMIKQGFKASDDPFESLAHRQLKSERLKSRSQVTEDFFRTYGTSSSTMTAKQAKELGMTKIAGPGMVQDVSAESGYKLNRTLSNYIEKTGESLYLPDDVAEAFKSYTALANINFSDELNGYLRLYDKALNFFKMSATIPFPGFHVKNMAGDIFMGYMDGVKAVDYNRFINANRTGKVKLGKSGVEMNMEDFDALFSKYGKSGGFVESELFPSPQLAEGGIKGAARNVGQQAKDLSGRREDFGREVHFMKALDEEFANLGIKSYDGKIASSDKFRKAMDNATYRINKYKFDYGALTKTEKQVMRRAIPFYTFLRKSTPLMLEGMLMNPSQFGKAHRFFDGEDSLGPRAAQWQREIGFANPFGGEEPLLLPQNILPTDALTSWGKDPLSLKNLADNTINSLSPIPKAAIELGMGRSTFTGQELFNGEDPSVVQQGKYLFDNLFPLGAAAEEQIVQPALQGAGLRDNSGSTAPNPMDDPAEFLFGSRFALGLGGRRLTNEDQINNANSELGKMQGELEKMSLQLRPYGIKIFVSKRPDGNSIKVRTLDGKKTIFDGNLQEAIEAAAQYASNPSNRVSKEDELIKYADYGEGVVKSGKRSEASPLDRILTPR